MNKVEGIFSKYNCWDRSRPVLKVAF